MDAVSRHLAVYLGAVIGLKSIPQFITAVPAACLQHLFSLYVAVLSLVLIGVRHCLFKKVDHLIEVFILK